MAFFNSLVFKNPVTLFLEFPQVLMNLKNKAVIRLSLDRNIYEIKHNTLTIVFIW